MALQGVFVADFSSFLTAVEQAEVKLRSFEQGSAKVESSLNRMVDSFSGRKIISEATLMAEAIERGGGTANLTARELERAGRTASEAAEKMRKLGIEVPANIQSVADAATKTNPPLTAMSVAVGTLVAQAAMKAAGSLSDFGKEAVTASTRAESLASVAKFMGMQAGYTGNEIDALAASMVKQGITTAQSYDTIIQMTRANLSLADATKLATTAQSLARATGQNSSETLANLIRGTQTLQVETLRNAGVVIQLDQEYIKFAATQGRTVTSLGAQEKQQIALNAVLREGEKVAGVYGVTNQNVGGKMQSMARYQEEAARAVGDQFLPAVRLATEAQIELLKAVKEYPALFAAAGTAIVGGTSAVVGLKAAQAAGVISTGTMTSALGLLWPAVAVGSTAFAAWNLGKWTGEVTGLTDGVERLTGRIMGLSDAEIEAGMAARKWTESAEGKAAAIQAERDALASLEKKAVELAQSEAKRAEENAKALAAAKEAMEAEKKRAAAMEELNSAGEGWRGTLAKLNEETVKAVKGYLEAGVSQGALATAYELTATEVRAIASALQEEAKAAKEAERANEELEQARKRAIEQASGLWDKYYDALREADLSTHNDRLKVIDDWKQAQIFAAVEAGTYTEEYYQRIEAAANQMTQAQMVNMDDLRKHSKTYAQEQASEAEATYQYVLAHAQEFTSAFIELKRREADEARQAANNWGNATIETLDQIEKKAIQAQAAMAGLQGPLTWSEAMDLVRQGKGTLSGTIQLPQPDLQPWGRRETGGPVMAGEPYIVGEKRPELFVPSTSGTILPFVPRGGMTVSNHYSISVSTVAGNPHEIARVVKQALVDADLSSGKRLLVS